MSSKKNIEDTKPIDVLADRVWAGDRYYYPGIERMIAELTRLRSRAAEAHEWEEMAERTGLPLKPDGAEAEIARLREIESQAKAAGFIGADGRVRKVLGTLPITADGCVVGIGGEVHYENRQHEIVSLPIGYRFELTGSDKWDSDGLFSTREAAEAAREGNK